MAKVSTNLKKLLLLSLLAFANHLFYFSSLHAESKLSKEEKQALKNQKKAAKAASKAVSNPNNVDSFDIINVEVTELNLSGVLYEIDLWLMQNRSYIATISIPKEDVYISSEVIYLNSQSIQVHLASSAGEIFDFVISNQDLYFSSLINNPEFGQCFDFLRANFGNQDLVLNFSGVTRLGYFYRLSEVHANEGSIGVFNRLGLDTSQGTDDAALINALNNMSLSAIVSHYGLIRDQFEMVQGINFNSLVCQ
ncbi:MAG: hypothetical protein H6625_02885 [Bdellovibrionaceae bacterium]|nr:hypothetical protein [Pseudobdellovibrionaceae bacterium]